MSQGEPAEEVSRSASAKNTDEGFVEISVRDTGSGIRPKRFRGSSIHTSRQRSRTRNGQGERGWGSRSADRWWRAIVGGCGLRASWARGRRLRSSCRWLRLRSCIRRRWPVGREAELTSRFFGRRCASSGCSVVEAEVTATQRRLFTGSRGTLVGDARGQRPRTAGGLAVGRCLEVVSVQAADNVPDAPLTNPRRLQSERCRLRSPHSRFHKGHIRCVPRFLMGAPRRLGLPP